MGGIALVFLLVAEFGFVLWLRGLSIREYLATRDPVSGTVYYVMLGIFAPELSPGNHHAGDVGSRVPAVFYCSMACRGNILVGRCRSLAGFGHPFHTHRHPADQ